MENMRFLLQLNVPKNCQNCAPLWCFVQLDWFKPFKLQLNMKNRNRLFQWNTVCYLRISRKIFPPIFLKIFHFKVGSKFGMHGVIELLSNWSVLLFTFVSSICCKPYLWNIKFFQMSEKLTNYLKFRKNNLITIWVYVTTMSIHIFRSLFTKCVGDSLAILRSELKSQKKHVRNLKKKSLWSKILEEVRRKYYFYFNEYY